MLSDRTQTRFERVTEIIADDSLSFKKKREKCMRIFRNILNDKKHPLVLHKRMVIEDYHATLKNPDPKYPDKSLLAILMNDGAKENVLNQFLKQCEYDLKEYGAKYFKAFYDKLLIEHVIQKRRER